MHRAQRPIFALLAAALLFACAAASAPAVDLFTSGQGYKYYRIPSLLQLSDGRIMCFAEGRNVAADVGWIDIVYRTSLDSSGTTWGPMRVLHSESTNTSHVSINNPAPVLDKARGSMGAGVVILFARNVKQIVMLRSHDPFGQDW